MTTIVGIFDNTHDLDKAVGRLARAGFEDTVYDEAIVAGEALNVGPPVFAPGSAPVVSSFWPEPTTSAPSKSWRSCESAALRG